MPEPENDLSLMLQKLLTIEQTIENLDHLLAEFEDFSLQIDQDKKNKLVKNTSALINISQQLKQKINDCKNLEINLRQEHNLQRNISVTQRQQEIIQHQYTETALRESEEKFHQVVENIEQVFWMTNIYLNHIDYISPAYEKVWGRSCQSLYEHPQSWFDAILPEDRAIVISKRNQQITGESVDVEYRILHTDGSIHWIWDRGFVIKNEQGEVCKLGGIAADITARKEAEEASQRARERLQAVLYAVPGFVAWFSEDLKYQGVNGHLAATFGLNPEDFAGKNIGFQNKVTDFSRFMHEFMASSDLTATQILNTQINGSIRNYLTVIQKYQQGKAAISVGIDITERQQAEAEIDKSLKKQQELNLLKSNFISMVSHEFRTPMFTILLSAKLLENYHSQWTQEKQLTHILRIQNAIKEMQELLEQVLTIGQAEAGKIDCKRKLIDLEKFCRELTDEMQLMTKTDQNIIFIHENIFKNTCMDERILRHVFTNLLSNAIKYSSEGSTIRFTLRCEDDNSQVAIFQVTDQGIGIPLEDQNHLFSTFYRCSNVGNISGTGLGLAIVKKSVEAHGGEISFASEVNVGTTFNVVIPLTK